MENVSLKLNQCLNQFKSNRIESDRLNYNQQVYVSLSLNLKLMLKLNSKNNGLTWLYGIWSNKNRLTFLLVCYLKDTQHFCVNDLWRDVICVWIESDSIGTTTTNICIRNECRRLCIYHWNTFVIFQTNIQQDTTND